MNLKLEYIIYKDIIIDRGIDHDKIILKKRVYPLMDNNMCLFGKAELSVVNGAVIGTISSKKDLSGLYPSIGYKIIKQVNERESVIEILAIYLSFYLNTDLEISPL